MTHGQKNMNVNFEFIRPSVRTPTGRIFVKFRIWVFFENLPRKFQFH